MLDKSIAIIFFNRPDLLAKVFAVVKKARPKKLYAISDGPRDTVEVEKVTAARKIIDAVNWDCQVFKNYSETNLGSKMRPFTGISWVFEHEEEAIILEDDCIPNQSFFRFASELLDYYRDNQKVFSIAGANHLNPNPKLNFSYWFSPLTSTWGFATWKRSWEKVDLNISKWPGLRETDWLFKKIGDREIANVYQSKLDKYYYDVYQNRAGWDYAYLFAMLQGGGLDLRPAVNMISNIGFRPDASNTRDITPWANVAIEEMEFPLKHPPQIKPQVELEVLLFEQTDPNYRRSSLLKKILPSNLKKFLSKLFKVAKRLKNIFAFKTEYKFSERDYLTYVFEELAHRKINLKELGDIGSLSRIQIENFAFFWPKNQGRKELTAVWQEVFNNALFNPHSYRAKHIEVKPNEIVVDAGAAEGFFVHYALQRGAKIFAFEPVPVLVECLHNTYQQEIKNQKIVIIPKLLGSQNKTTNLEINSQMLTMSKEKPGESDVQVQMISLDEWFQTARLSKIDFLKMDIEGGEVEAIQGAKMILTKFKPKLAIAVYHEYENAEIIKNLLQAYRPDYQISFRGIFDYGNVKPRPFMIFAH